eukprot:TRINITY_DN912_c1_g1_i2.p1 TRINITY_DN912_c1_g1~~TRINITY_DN912_c1_g1_i2.p1  ORF type:complete len:1876 (-),score=622.51 TRINITY_DN912_c1_g1_i2:229-5856(-)
MQSNLNFGTLGASLPEMEQSQNLNPTVLINPDALLSSENMENVNLPTIIQQPVIDPAPFNILGFTKIKEDFELQLMVPETGLPLSIRKATATEIPEVSGVELVNSCVVNGDCILHINGVGYDSFEEYQKAITKLEPNAEVIIKFRRYNVESIIHTVAEGWTIPNPNPGAQQILPIYKMLFKSKVEAIIAYDKNSINSIWLTPPNTRAPERICPNANYGMTEEQMNYLTAQKVLTEQYLLPTTQQAVSRRLLDCRFFYMGVGGRTNELFGALNEVRTHFEAVAREQKMQRIMRRPIRDYDEDTESGSDSDDDAAHDRRIAEGNFSDDGEYRPAAHVRKNEGPLRRSTRNRAMNISYAVSDSDEESEDDEVKIAKRERQAERDRLQKLDKIIAGRYVKSGSSKYEFLVKWKNKSYLHLEWVQPNMFGECKQIRLMKQWLKEPSNVIQPAHVHAHDGEDDISEYFSPTFTQIDRLLACKDVDAEVPTDDNKENSEEAAGFIQVHKVRRRMYLVKWCDLSYKECTWEFEEDIQDDAKVEQFIRFNSPVPIQQMTYRGEVANFKGLSESPQFKGGRKLREYQLEGLNWLVFNWVSKRSCILADEMGLGKTIQTVAFINALITHHNNRGPFLVVAPLSTLGHWKREVEDWTDLNCVVYHDNGGAAGRSVIREHEWFFQDPEMKRQNQFKFHILLTSHSILRTDREFLERVPWKALIMDEGHILKNQDSKLQVYLKDFTREHTVLMTGTPLQNSVDELWSLLNFIEPQRFSDLGKFLGAYGNLKDSDQVSRLHQELKPYMLRRVKEDVERSIPPKEETIIDVELTNVQKQYYRAIFEKNRTFLCKGKASIINFNNIEMELRKCCNHPFLIRGVEDRELANDFSQNNRVLKLLRCSGKMVLLDKLLPKLRAEGHKVLIFSQFVRMLNLIEELLQHRGYPMERLDGSVRGNERQEAIDRFNDISGNSFAFLLSTRAGGVGINLTAADTVIIFDSDWNPQNDVQATARCHRIGQKSAVRIYRLVTNGTYEAEMFERANRKLGLSQAVFETGGVYSQFDQYSNLGPNIHELMQMDKGKIEMLLRFGAYAIMGDDQETESFTEQDIDTILSSKSRTIRYDSGQKKEDHEGLLNFSKATFHVDENQAQLDFKDPKFWEKVLGPKRINQLQTKLESEELRNENDEFNVKFMHDLGCALADVLESRMTGQTHDDTVVISGMLRKLTEDGPFIDRLEMDVKVVAAVWLNDLEKPRRRGSKMAYSETVHYFDELCVQYDPAVFQNAGQRQAAQTARKVTNDMITMIEANKKQKIRGGRTGPKKRKRKNTSVSDDESDIEAPVVKKGRRGRRKKLPEKPAPFSLTAVVNGQVVPCASGIKIHLKKEDIPDPMGGPSEVWQVIGVRAPQGLDVKLTGRPKEIPSEASFRKAVSYTAPPQGTKFEEVDADDIDPYNYEFEITIPKSAKASCQCPMCKHYQYIDGFFEGDIAKCWSCGLCLKFVSKLDPIIKTTQESILSTWKKYEQMLANEKANNSRKRKRSIGSSNGLDNQKAKGEPATKRTKRDGTEFTSVQKRELTDLQGQLMRFSDEMSKRFLLAKQEGASEDEMESLRSQMLSEQHRLSRVLNIKQEEFTRENLARVAEEEAEAQQQNMEQIQHHQEEQFQSSEEEFADQEDDDDFIIDDDEYGVEESKTSRSSKAKRKARGRPKRSTPAVTEQQSPFVQQPQSAHQLQQQQQQPGMNSHQVIGVPARVTPASEANIRISPSIQPPMDASYAQRQQQQQQQQQQQHYQHQQQQSHDQQPMFLVPEQQQQQPQLQGMSNLMASPPRPIPQPQQTSAFMSEQVSPNSRIRSQRLQVQEALQIQRQRQGHLLHQQEVQLLRQQQQQQREDPYM